MFSLLHYISASRRLKESDKTIFMLGGKEDCDAMILAQNEMIKLERDYYKEETIKFGIILASIGFSLLVGLALYYRIYNV
jgi:hypothetical protein